MIASGKNSMYRMRPMSERVAQPELQDARIAGAGDPAEQAGVRGRVRISQVHAVERVEAFGAKLHSVMFGPRHCEDLEQREIQVGITWADESVAAQRAERARSPRTER